MVPPPDAGARDGPGQQVRVCSALVRSAVPHSGNHVVERKHAGTMVWLRWLPGSLHYDTAYLLQQVTACVVALAAAYAAMASVRPGSRASGSVGVAVVVAMFCVSLIVGWTSGGTVSGEMRAMLPHTDWPCVAALAMVSGVLWFGSVPRLREGVPMAPKTTVLLSAMAAVSVANVVACLARSHATSEMVLLWHGATILALLAVVHVVGYRVVWPGEISGVE